MISVSSYFNNNIISNPMKKEQILVIGANGQIGSVLVAHLRSIYGEDHVLASDIHSPLFPSGRFTKLDATNAQDLAAVVHKNNITQIYHLAAILSAKGEQDPMFTWDVNMRSFFNVLETARIFDVKKVFFPSSIAVFGAHATSQNTPQWSALDPTTVYGISKVAGENWAQYYFQRYGLDIRSVRYPGIISYQSLPGGGTTDYAVDIFHKAVNHEHFECFLKKDSRLPMIYMDDVLKGTLQLMEAPADQVKVRTSYNLASISFTPEELANEIKKHQPDFSISYNPDFRQAIADSWPDSIDDSAARTDWGWSPDFDLAAMTKEMLTRLQQTVALV
jgi:nucleoside-diphosphate-sugar epimerase